MRRRYDPNQLELFPEFVNQDVSQASKRSRMDSQRSAERDQRSRSNRSLHIAIQLPLALGCGCRGREELPDATDDIEQEMSSARGDAIDDEAVAEYIPGLRGARR
jgi:hypothetical protein